MENGTKIQEVAHDVPVENTAPKENTFDSVKNNFVTKFEKIEVKKDEL